MFHRLDASDEASIEVEVEGRVVSMRPGESAAAAALLAGLPANRISPVTHAPRAAYCLMGACFECLMVIDDIPSRQACLVPVRPGMRIRRQARAGNQA